jgi:hypothetical protein
MRLITFLLGERTAGSRHLMIALEALLALTTCLLLARAVLLP